MFRKTLIILAMMFAILGPGAKAWGQAPVNTVLWGENFAHFGTNTPSSAGTGTGTTIYDNASITYAQSSTNTKGYDEKLAGGTAPELLLSKSNQTWTISGIKSGGAKEISLTFLSNKTTFSLTCSSSDAYTVSGSQKSWTLTLGDGKTAPETFNITLKNTGSSNARIDDVVLKVTKASTPSTTPTCTINPTSHDFGEIAVGGNATFDFTVTTANLTEDLALEVSEGFSVSPATIESTETETTVTVTCAPTAVGALDGTLTISGGGLTDDVTATLSATGLCTAPENELAYTTPVKLQLTDGEAEATLAPIANTGNGGTITYELIAGDEDHFEVEESTGEIYTDAIGSYTVRATQAVNGTICGGTFDIEINVTSTSPSCSISPSGWNFGNVTIGTPASKTFTVTTANLTGDLTVGLSMGETTYSVTPTTISQSATSAEVTVTFTPDEDGLVEELLTISGGGLTSAVEVVLSATGISPYTVTYVAVNGDAPQAAIVEQGSSITLGTVENVDCNTWQFAGWSESENSTEAPTLMAGDEYTPTENVTLYAVYKKAEASEPTQVPFVFADIAEANNWQNSQAYTSVVIDPVTITANGGGNNGKYYTSDETWRMYNGGSVKITSTGNNITAVSSDPSTTFSINNGEASLNFNATTKFKSITVTCTPPTSFSYSTTPSCLEIVATPTITPNGGEFIGSQEITLACTTEGASISYTTDDWENSNTYSAPFTITATTTLKVKATKEGMSESEVATATFTKIPVLETMQEIFDASATAGNYYVKFNDYVVSGVTSSNAYITDGEKGFIVYNKSSHGFAVGNILNGTVQLALTRYGGAAEFTNLTSTTEGISVTTGGTITPTEVSIADLSGVNTGAVIIASNVIYTGNGIFSDGTNTITAYNAFMTLPSFTNGDSYNITGVYIQYNTQYNTTREIAPRNADDIQLIVAAPTFTPEGGNYNAAQNVEIASATAGAAIYYTLDGSDPTVESTLYSAPIELTSNTTLKAIAAKAGSVSEIAIAVYTITITTVATPTFEPEDGSYFNESLEVSLDCATDGATIVYTTDNWSTQKNYTAPFTITETTTVKAKATKTDMDDSEIAEATFTKRYKVNYVVNGNATAIASVYVTPGEALGTPPTATAPNGYTFMGWSENEFALTNFEPTYITDETVPTDDMTLYAVFAIAEGGGDTAYVKVTEEPADWSGDYLLVYEGEDDAVAWTGADESNCYVEVTIANDEIAGTEGAAVLTIAPMDGGYSIQVNNGQYIGQDKYDNGITFSNNALLNNLSLNDNNAVITAKGANNQRPTMRYNKTSGQDRFRYYKSGQQSVQLYKYSAPSTTYSNFCTTVNALSGNLAGAMTEAGKAYYISEAATVEGKVTINGVLGNANASLLIIEDGGQLIFNNSGVKAIVEKNIVPYGSSKDEDVPGWHFLAAPMEDFTVASFIEQAGEGGYDLYRWRIIDGTPTWYNYKAHDSNYDSGFETYFFSGRGYLAAYETTNLLKMQGTLNAGTTFDFTEELNGEGHFTLLGNPFTYDLKWSDFNNKTSIYDGFAVVNSQTGIIEYVIGDVKTIIVGTGFMVYTEENGAELSFEKGSGSASGKSNDILALNLFASNENGEDNTIIVIDDRNGGFAKADNFNTNVPQIYTERLQTKYGIRNFSTNTKEFFVSFKAVGEGSNTIRLETIGEFDYVHLYDKLTDVDVDMLLEGSYTFEASEGDDTHRFIVRIDKGNTGIDENETENFVNVYNGEIHVSGSGEVQIFDVMGRIVHSEVISGDATISTGGFKGGVYVVRLIGDGWTKTEKIVVRR